MNQLPQVLQKEIWEYVRGDRTFWKQQFQKAADHVECLGHFSRSEIVLGHETMAPGSVMLKWRKTHISRVRTSRTYVVPLATLLEHPAVCLIILRGWTIFGLSIGGKSHGVKNVHKKIVHLGHDPEISQKFPDDRA
jgi:hypothetical protein